MKQNLPLNRECKYAFNYAWTWLIYFHSENRCYSAIWMFVCEVKTKSQCMISIICLRPSANCSSRRAAQTNYRKQYLPILIDNKKKIDGELILQRRGPEPEGKGMQVAASTTKFYNQVRFTSLFMRFRAMGMRHRGKLCHGNMCYAVN